MEKKSENWSVREMDQNIKSLENEVWKKRTREKKLGEVAWEGYKYENGAIQANCREKLAGPGEIGGGGRWMVAGSIGI